MIKQLSLFLSLLVLTAFVFPSASQASVYALTTADTTIYTPPSGGNEAVLTPIPAQTNVKIIEEQSERIRVTWQGVNGFIARKFLAMDQKVESAASGQFFQLKTDAELLQKQNGKLVKAGRLLTGEVFQKSGIENGYITFAFGTATGYVAESATEALSNASLAGGVQPGAALNQTAMANVTADLLYSKNGKLTALGRLQAGTVFQIKAAYREYYIISIGGRTAYVRKSHVTLYTGNYVNPFKAITYSQMVQDLKELVRWHSSIASLEVIGKSVDGRDLHALKLGTGNEKVLINASHHGREHMTTSVVMEMIDQYAHQYKQNGKINGYSVRSILNKTSIYFVPMVNPDGVSLVQFGSASAKNRTAALKLNGGSNNFSAWKANVRGIDLNRQYPADWNNVCCDPGKPASKNHKGPRALSEPESRALYNFTNKHSFKAVVAYHSSGQIIFWHYNQSGSRKTRDRAIALKLNNKTGYSLVAPQSEPSGGGYKDWFIQKTQKPGFTIEISPYVGERPVPLVYFTSIWNQNNSVGLMLANETIR